MDIDNYMLVKDENAIKVSEQDSFILIPTESIEEVAPVISNVLGDYTIESRKFNINVFPKFAIEELSYTTFRKGNTEKKDYTNTLEISPVVLNGDSVVLEILTNEDKLGPFKKESSKFSWNKDGKDLNDSLYMVEDCKLIIPKYNKETMDGKYNCIVTNCKTTFTVTFDVTSNYPTSNETIDTNDFRVLCQDGHVLISNAVSKHLVISDTSGKMLVNKVITSDMEQISVPKNTVLFVTIEGKTIKTVSK
nr:MAG TPA: Interleukin-6 receptor [Bacteriophage sp.]